VPETDEELAEKSRGKSRRARQIRKRIELYNICTRANKTTMDIYIPTLVSVIDSIYSVDRLLLIFFHFRATAKFLLKIISNMKNCYKISFKNHDRDNIVYKKTIQ
jgi:hypothetical protein